jgi:hypothetical protein
LATHDGLGLGSRPHPRTPLIDGTGLAHQQPDGLSGLVTVVIGLGCGRESHHPPTATTTTTTTTITTITAITTPRATLAPVTGGKNRKQGNHRHHPAVSRVELDLGRKRVACGHRGAACKGPSRGIWDAAERERGVSAKLEPRLPSVAWPREHA